MNSLPIYSVLVQWLTGSRRSSHIATKWVEIPAPDIVQASQLALNTLKPNLALTGVSMIWQKTETRSINGQSRLVHLFTDGARLWQGDKLGWLRV